jgi:hypothetical protein
MFSFAPKKNNAAMTAYNTNCENPYINPIK